jgi:hypothetical protein
VTSKVPVLARLRGCALAAGPAACVALACAGCAPAATPTTAAVSRPAATATAVPSATGAPSAGPASLAASKTVRRELLAAFIAFRRNAANTPGYAAIPPSAVGGIAPGTLSYAWDPATGTYWAAASFDATKAATRTPAFVGFQDGGNSAVFMRPAGQPWLVRSVGPCLTGLPVAVATALALRASPSPMCPSGIPAATPSASATGPGGIRNLLISSAALSELTEAFVAYKGIPLSDVSGAGPVPGSVYYAYDAATDIHWALAHFEPSSKAPLNVQVSFQDGAAEAMFRKAGAGSWEVQAASEPDICAYLKFFPLAVLMAWSMSTSPPAGMC